MPIYRRFWVKIAISVWMYQIIVARCRKRNIGAISGLYPGYLEHWYFVYYTLFLLLNSVASVHFIRFIYLIGYLFM